MDAKTFIDRLATEQGTAILPKWRSTIISKLAVSPEEADRLIADRMAIPTTGMDPETVAQNRLAEERAARRAGSVAYRASQHEEE